MKLAAAFLASALFVSQADAQCTGCFHSSFGAIGREFPAGFFDHFVVADFDGDGFLDVAAVDSLGIQILKGSGSGALGAPVHFDGSAPTQIGVGDFNGDGFPDIATAGDKVSVYLGNGDGTFQAPLESDSGVEANGLAVADFNHDGNPDLAVDSAINGPRVYFGNGDGTVQPALVLGSVNGGFVVAGDFNGDGIPDVAVGSFDGIHVHLSDGRGSFSAAIVSGVGGARMAVGDFNRDGIDDLAATSALGVLIELGNGDGTFTTGNDYPAGNGAFAIAVGDFTLDGLVDLAVAEDSGGVAILNGHGDGTFETGDTIPHAAGELGEIAVADFDANGRLDVAVVDGDRYVEILLADAAGDFFQAVTYPTGGTTDPSQPPAVALGDFTGGGHLDLAVANIGSLTVGVLPGDGAGGFGAPVSIPVTSPPRWLAAGSFHPSHTDLAVATDAGIQVILSNGDGTFQVLPPFGTLTAYVTSADFDSDGNADLAWIGNQLNISLGNGDGTFTDGPPISGSPTGEAVAVGFFNADVNLDLVLSSRDQVTVLAGDGAGGFTQSFTYPFPDAAFTKVAAADFDGDGKVDVVVVHFSADELLNAELYWGNGDGTLQTPPDELAAGIYPFDVHGADVNGDGLPDIVIHDYAAFTILASHGDRTFEASTWVPPLFSGFSEPGDLDGDGKTDLALAGGFPLGASVLFNTNCVPSKLVMSLQPSSCNMSGVAFGTQPSLSVLDGGDNLMTCDDGTVVRAAIRPGTGAPGAHLGGQSIVPTGAGMVTFASLSIDRPGRGYVLTFTHPSVGTTISRTLSQDLTAVLSGPATICNLGEGTYRTAGGYDRYQWLLDGCSHLPGRHGHALRHRHRSAHSRRDGVRGRLHRVRRGGDHRARIAASAVDRRAAVRAGGCDGACRVRDGRRQCLCLVDHRWDDHGRTGNEPDHVRRGPSGNDHDPAGDRLVGRRLHGA